MIENQKLANLLVKIEQKIDCFFRDCNMNSDIAKDVKDLIQDKLNILDKGK